MLTYPASWLVAHGKRRPLKQDTAAAGGIEGTLCSGCPGILYSLSLSVPTFYTPFAFWWECFHCCKLLITYLPTCLFFLPYHLRIFSTVLSMRPRQRGCFTFSCQTSYLSRKAAIQCMVNHMEQLQTANSASEDSWAVRKHATDTMRTLDFWQMEGTGRGICFAEDS